ncbi:catalase family protein [Pseudoxanthomonas indica]|uniref:Catalase n=1 Tax=Pseudoxanthomonas indica TaxID=428993 RepID=A0A1T5LU02_9GAMM|nr:catalase family protein [Pseudoxanthomonas indica]GGD39185.1 catalase [Pseudoxanthomonas indica]SKC79048.1 hypothetical protein SAMN06296058_3029 [Pseudoxanthomonas indica]
MAQVQPPIIYRPEYEQTELDEQHAIDQLIEVFSGMARTVADHEGHAHRAVHAKGQALLRGWLEVEANLPEELAQGLFAQAGGYETLIRLWSPPAEQLPDNVSTPRAIALKVIGVQGERVAGDDEAHTQDFLMVNGPAFSAPGPAGFVRSAKLLAATTEKMPRTKRVISATLRGTEAALEALGGESGKLKGLGGEPQHHPLGETFFTQVPFLYGPYMAKFSLAPLSPALLALRDQHLASTPEAQREAITEFFSTLDAPAEWELRVQLCRNLERMPIEDASVPWPEQDSPWQTVARLSIPTQTGWDGHASEVQEDSLAFAPWHALAAHRPLGAVNRARRQVMAASREFRSGFNGCPIREPGR